MMGVVLGLPAMWLFSRLANLPELQKIALQKKQLMRKALTHQGSFAELLTMQKNIVLLALTHMRVIGLPGLCSASPLILFLGLRPEYATIPFGVGVLIAYAFAKWRWGI